MTIDRALAKERSERLEYTRKTENILDKLRQELNEEKRKAEELGRVKSDLSVAENDKNKLATEIARLHGEAVSRDCELFELEDARKRMQTKIDQLGKVNEEFSHTVRVCEDLHRELLQVKDQNDFASAENEELKLKVATCLGKEQSLSKELAKISDTLEVTKDDLNTATRKVQQLDSERRQTRDPQDHIQRLRPSVAAAVRRALVARSGRRRGRNDRLAPEEHAVGTSAGSFGPRKARP